MKRPTFDELIARGVKAHQNARFAEALKEFRAALNLRSLDAEAQSLYGLALVALGRYAEAEAPLRQAVEREPAEMGFRFNLVEFLEKTQQYDDAAEQLEAIVEKNTKIPRAWGRLGDVRMLQARAADARDAFARALELDPSEFAFALKLARVCAALRDGPGAQAALDVATRLRPTDPATLRLQIEVLVARRDWPALEAAAERLTRTHPNEVVGWYSLSRALLEQGRFRQSANAFRAVLERAGETPEHLTMYGRICMQAQDYALAMSALERAEARAPRLAEMLAAKGLLLTYFGRLDEARAYCRRCVEQHPDYVQVYAQLSRLEHGRFSDREMSELFRLSNDAGIEPENRISATFALADGYDARGEVEVAFTTYQRANAASADIVRAEGVGYDRRRSEARTERLKTLFATASDPAEGLARLPTPIFVVGMPRSGTTLVESILSAHSRVFACGERGAMPYILGEYLTTMSRAAPPAPGLLRRWIDGYYREIPDLGGADHFTDKHPLNFEAVGLIAQLFPNAKFVHVRRNPLETGLSIFRHEFTKFWPFAHRLEDIGHFYGQYAQLVAHWARVMPDRFMTIQYEDLVTDIASRAPALVAACGFAWEAQCLDFQNAPRAISTFSAVQAREPVSLRNGRAERYRRHLDALADALREGNVDLTTGALCDAERPQTTPLRRGLSRLKLLAGSFVSGKKRAP